MRLNASLMPRLSSLITVICIVLFSVVLFGCGGSEPSSGGVATGSVTLSWQTPTLNEDGTLVNDLEGFRVYYGEISGSYTDVVNVGIITIASIGNLPLGKTIHFAVSAIDTSGNESVLSTEVDAVAL